MDHDKIMQYLNEDLVNLEQRLPWGHLERTKDIERRTAILCAMSNVALAKSLEASRIRSSTHNEPECRI